MTLNVYINRRPKNKTSIFSNTGCPACIQYNKCGEHNYVLDQEAACLILSRISKDSDSTLEYEKETPLKEDHRKVNSIDFSPGRITRNRSATRTHEPWIPSLPNFI